MIDLNNKQLIIKGDPTHGETTIAEILQVELEEEEEDIVEVINQKIQEITELTNCYKEELRKILTNNKTVFRETPGRIITYCHTFELTDKTPYCQKGWPIPVRYQDAVRTEIRRMEEHGVIERAQSSYINPMVTVIKKDQTVRLCFCLLYTSRCV